MLEKNDRLFLSVKLCLNTNRGIFFSRPNDKKDNKVRGHSRHRFQLKIVYLKGVKSSENTIIFLLCRPCVAPGRILIKNVAKETLKPGNSCLRQENAIMFSKSSKQRN